MMTARHRVFRPWTLGVSVVVHGGAVAALLFALPLEARIQDAPGVEIALISPAAGLPEPEPAATVEPEEARLVEALDTLMPVEPPPDVTVIEPPPEPAEPIEPEPPEPIEAVEASSAPAIVEAPSTPAIVEAPSPEPALISAEAPDARAVAAKPPRLKVAVKPPPAKPASPVAQPARQIEREAPPSSSPPAHAKTPSLAATAAVSDARAMAFEADLRAHYMAELSAWLERHKRYPRVAQRQRREGTALLAFAMGKDGNVLSYELRESTGHMVLDDEVKAMIERATPLPPIPPELDRTELEVVVPVKFSVR